MVHDTLRAFLENDITDEKKRERGKKRRDRRKDSPAADRALGLLTPSSPVTAHFEGGERTRSG